MKRNILLLTGLVVIVVLFLLLKPARQYNWEPTFAHNSEEPFGCKLFDEMAAATMPKGYSFSDDDPDELLSSNGGMALLIIKSFDYNDEWDFHRVQQLEEFVRRGNKLMIVCNSFNVDYYRGKTFEKEALGDELDDISQFGPDHLNDSIQTIDFERVGLDAPKANPDSYNSDETMKMDDNAKKNENEPDLLSGFFGIEDDNNKTSNLFYLLETFYDLGINDNEYFTVDNLRKALSENEPGDSIVWLTPQTDIFRICKYLAGRYFPEIPENSEALAKTQVTKKRVTYKRNKSETIYHTSEDTIAFRLQIGDGTFYAHCNPLLFTNYGVLNHDISRYLNHAMAPLADCKVVRMPAEKFLKDSYLESEENPEKMPKAENRSNPSPLSYLLSQPPLRWALYTILAAVLLFMFFTARRRQRVVPVIKQPENRNLQFVKLISSIYYHRNDCHDLLRKKYTYFKDDLRRVLQIDIEDKSLLKINIQTLSRLTGFEGQVIEDTLKDIRFYTDASVLLEKEDMMKYIDFMNDILKKI